jgi:predicted enzyme related to lactoylglutathione lyase
MDVGRIPTLEKEASRPDQSAELRFVLTHTLIVRDIQRSAAFYRDVLGATVLREGEPTFLRFGNIWLTINRGGGSADDKPEVIASPPRDENVLSIFLNLRVTDIRRYYDSWSSRGAQFITEPKVNCDATCATQTVTSLKSDKRPVDCRASRFVPMTSGESGLPFGSGNPVDLKDQSYKHDLWKDSEVTMRRCFAGTSLGSDWFSHKPGDQVR